MVDSIVEQAKCAGQSPGKWSDEVDRLGGRRKADNGQAGIRSHVAGGRIASQRTEHAPSLHRMGANVAYIPSFVHLPPAGWLLVQRQQFDRFPARLQELLERSVESR